MVRYTSRTLTLNCMHTQMPDKNTENIIEKNEVRLLF